MCVCHCVCVCVCVCICVRVRAVLRGDFSYPHACWKARGGRVNKKGRQDRNTKFIILCALRPSIIVPVFAKSQRDVFRYLMSNFIGRHDILWKVSYQRSLATKWRNTTQSMLVCYSMSLSFALCLSIDNRVIPPGGSVNSPSLLR